MERRYSEIVLEREKERGRDDELERKIKRETSQRIYMNDMLHTTHAINLAHA